MLSSTALTPVANITTQSRTNVLVRMALQTGFLSGSDLRCAASGGGTSLTLRCNTKRHLEMYPYYANRIYPPTQLSQPLHLPRMQREVQHPM